MGLFRWAAITLSALATSHAFAIGNIAKVEIVDRASGKVLPVHMKDGEAWVAGTPGAKYSIRLRNNQWGRILAVMSVDGVNVLSGETAASSQTGYVYSHYERGDISGWRKSDSEIAAFEFVASPQSYAERTGRPDHVGVIGVALFNEKTRIVRNYLAPESNLTRAPIPSAAPLVGPAPRQESDSAAAAEMSKSRSRALSDESTMKLGTGHGEREISHTTRVAFTRESESPNEVIRIRYDSRENLIARGVIAPKYAGGNPLPSAFPRDSYVPDPPAMR